MRKIFYGWWVVLASFVMTFYVGGVVFFGFTAFFEPIQREFGWSYTQVSLAASLRGLEMGIFAPIVGLVVDRLGARLLILGGIVAVSLGLLALSFTHSLATFYCACLLIAFGAGGCTTVVLTTVVANWFHKDIGKALGVMMSGYGASGLMVPSIVSLIAFYDWRTTLVILGIGTLVLGIPLSLIIRNKPEDHGYLPDGVGSRDTHLTHSHHATGNRMGLREAFRDRTFVYLNAAEALRMMILMAVITHIMPYLSIVAIERTAAGVVAGAVPLFSIAGRFGFGWLGDIFDKRHVLACTYAFMGLGMLAFCYPNAVGMIVFFLVLFSPGFGGGATLRGAIIRAHFGRDSFGKIFGMVMGSTAVGGIIGPTLAGWVYDTTGSYMVMWAASCVLLGLCVVLIERINALPPDLSSRPSC